MKHSECEEKLIDSEWKISENKYSLEATPLRNRTQKVTNRCHRSGKTAIIWTIFRSIALRRGAGARRNRWQCPIINRWVTTTKAECREGQTTRDAGNYANDGRRGRTPRGKPISGRGGDRLFALLCFFFCPKRLLFFYDAKDDLSETIIRDETRTQRNSWSCSNLTTSERTNSKTTPGSQIWSKRDNLRSSFTTLCNTVKTTESWTERNFKN